jgi:branched-chain amino acid transport system substrate-binding protein
MISVGLLTDRTGAAASTFADTAGGANARFFLQNSEGGVDGRLLKLVVVDTTSTPVGAQTAAEVLVAQKAVFGVIAVSALTFGASVYLHAQGIPVVGSALDGPEWYREPNGSMFNIEGVSSPHYPSYTTEGVFYRSLGVDRVGFVADNTPSSARGVKQVINSVRHAGLQTCADIVVPLGAVDFTGIALSIKHVSCEAVECSCLLSTSLALATALRDAGLDIPVVFDAGPAQEVLASSAATRESAGDFFPAETYYSGAAYDSFIDSLKRYDPRYTGGVPDLGVIDGWQAADLFITGLQVAGQDPTRRSFVAQLRQVPSWDANGLRVSPVSFHPFGQAPAQFCLLYLTVDNSQYADHPASGTPYCGMLIPHSNTS